MSTRRTTRATSRQASSRGASPATTEIPATPRRNTRRSGNTPLPAVGTRTSTAYGTNTVAQPGRAAGPQVSAQISSVLQNLLEPVREHDNASNAPSRGGRTGHTPSRASTARASRTGSTEGPSMVDNNNISYTNESGIFNAADIDSSVASPGDLDDIPEEEYQSSSSEAHSTSIENLNENAQRQALEEKARQDRIRHEQATADPVARAGSLSDRLAEKLNLQADRLSFILKCILMAGAALVVFWFILTSLLNTDYHNYGYSPLGMKHNIGQFIPTRGIFSSDDLNDLRSRITNAEREIIKLKQRSDLDKKTVSKLEEILPDFIVGTKDKLGNFILPTGLWHAIQDKIRTDHTLVFENVGKGNKGENNAVVSTKDIDKIVGKSWEKFLKANEVKVKAASGDGIDQRFPDLLESAFNDKILLRKPEVIGLIKRTWEDNQADIKTEMTKLSKELSQVTQSISKLQQGPAGHTKAEVQSIATDIFKKMLPNAQLSALSKSNLKSNINYGLTRVNHFSRGTGAVVNPHHTSPNYVFPSMDLWAVNRAIRGFFQNPVPVPNPPSAALTKWEEHGDCWCSPTKNADGFGPSLGVIMGSNIFPEEVVIEHIAPTAALEPGAAPREMELLAYIPDADLYAAIKATSDELFREEAESDKEQSYRYVRIATWTYDIESSENIQAFSVQLDLKQFNAHTNKLIIRSKSNWGGGNVDYTCLYRVRVHGEIFATPGIY